MTRYIALSICKVLSHAPAKLLGQIAASIQLFGLQCNLGSLSQLNIPLCKSECASDIFRGPLAGYAQAVRSRGFVLMFAIYSSQHFSQEISEVASVNFAFEASRYSQDGHSSTTA